MIEEISWSKPQNDVYTIEGWVNGELKSITASFEDLVEFVEDEGLNIVEYENGTIRPRNAYNYTDDNIVEVIEAYFTNQFKIK